MMTIGEELGISGERVKEVVDRYVKPMIGRLRGNGDISIAEMIKTISELPGLSRMEAVWMAWKVGGLIDSGFMQGRE